MQHKISKFLVVTACLTCFADDQSMYLNGIGKDRKFHLKPDMYMCLNFSFDSGEDIGQDSRLKADLLFDKGLKDNKACTPVTQAMIDKQNWIIATLAAQNALKPMKPGETRTVNK